VNGKFKGKCQKMWKDKENQKTWTPKYDLYFTENKYILNVFTFLHQIIKNTKTKE